MSAENAALNAPSKGISPKQLFIGPWTIAVFTWRESIRKKTMVGFLILSLLVIFGATVMTSMMQQDTVGSAAAAGPLETQTKLIKDICVSAISIFGALITIFISASVVPSEIENKVIYTVLSKPVRRLQYLIGKFVGVQLTVLLNLVLMGGLFFIALWAREGMPPTLLLWAMLLMFFEFLILSAFTFAISCTSSSSVLPTIAGLFIYITGNLTEYLKDVSVRAEHGTSMEQLVGQLAQILYNILPNLQNFSLKNDIVQGMVNDPPPFEIIPNLIVYSLIFSAIGFCLSYVIFLRKEL
ncbi:MAG: ABC transporter permease subunit [Candidatus Hydrogenedens sp.]|nr:ABC transporter permease subunit [Candidatus Hydrogenedens sp.]